MKLVKCGLLMIALVIVSTLFACQPNVKNEITNNNLVLLEEENWAPDVKKGINDLIIKYGKTSKFYDKDSYVVFDFDNTISIFDIQDQALIYQLENMCFAKDPDSFDEALRVDLNGKYDDYITDIISAYKYLYENYGPFTPSGLNDEMRKKVIEDPMWSEFASKMRLLADDIDNYVDNWKIRWFVGMTEKEIYDICYNSCIKYKEIETQKQAIKGPENLKSLLGPKEVTIINGLTVTSNNIELLRVLSENGIDVWVCSASENNQVRAAIDAFGLNEYCTGVVGKTMQMKDGLLLPKYDYETGYSWLLKNNRWIRGDYPVKSSCRGSGKVKAIENAIAPYYNGKYPIAGFMDSSGDFNFCTEFATLKLVVCYNHAQNSLMDGGGLIASIAMYQKQYLKYDLEKAENAGDTLYLLQGRDENKYRSLINDNLTISFEKEAKNILPDVGNAILYNYIMDNKLTIPDAINTFAIKTKATNSKNILGIDYGFLTDYNGYHSISNGVLRNNNKFKFKYWNDDSEALETLIDYVEDVTDESSANYIPKADRVVVFDMDGTLYCETEPTCIEEILFMKRVFDDKNFIPSQDFIDYANMIKNAVDTHIEYDDVEFSTYNARAFAGMTIKEFADYVKEFVETTEVPSFNNLTYANAWFLPMLEIVDYLNENDFIIYACSGTDRYTCRALMEDRVNILPENVIGCDVAFIPNNYTGLLGESYEYTYEDKLVRGNECIAECWEGDKVNRIAIQIGHQPVLLFGNSSGDSSMAIYTTSDNPYKSAAFMLMTDNEEMFGTRVKEIYDKRKVGWEENGFNIFSMKNDFKTVFGDNVTRKK